MGFGRRFIARQLLLDQIESLPPGQFPARENLLQEESALPEAQREPLFVHFVCMIVRNSPASMHKVT